jgi:DNA-binding CsgD family transcriptional regulator
VNHCHDLLGRLAAGRLGLMEFTGAALPSLRRAIGFDGWCLGLADPASRMPAVSATDVGNTPLSGRLQQFWQFEFADGAMGTTAAPQTLVRSAAARRDPLGARRYSELLVPDGVGDELRIHLFAGLVYWGSLGLFRSGGGRPFGEADVAAAGTLRQALAIGARSTWAAVPSRPAGAGAAEPGMLLLTSGGAVISETEQARHWIGRLGGHQSVLPAMVAALGTRVAASLRTRTADGVWLRVSGAWLDPPAGQAAIAVTLQAATPTEITPLLLRAYGLTPRQRLVTRFVLAGQSSQQIATALHLSPHTVNDHVKAITAKVGVHSRAELAAVLTIQPRAR